VARARLDVLISRPRPVAALDPARRDGCWSSRCALHHGLRRYLGRLDGAALEILALARRVVLVCEPTCRAWLAKEKARCAVARSGRPVTCSQPLGKDAQLSISDMEGLMDWRLTTGFRIAGEIRQTVLRARRSVRPASGTGAGCTLGGPHRRRIEPAKAAPEAQDRVFLAGAGRFAFRLQRQRTGFDERSNENTGWRLPGAPGGSTAMPDCLASSRMLSAIRRNLRPVPGGPRFGLGRLSAAAGKRRRPSARLRSCAGAWRRCFPSARSKGFERNSMISSSL